MNKNEIRDWLIKHDMDRKRFALVIGVTPSAVDHWLTGRRSMPLVVSRMCRLLEKHPQLITEIEK